MPLLDRLLGRKPDDTDADMERARGLAAAGDYAGALAIWEPLARKGHARARNNIGACFAEGLGVERDSALAHRWIGLAAEAGDPVGQRNLAALYFRGEGVEQDDAGPPGATGWRPRTATRRRRTCWAGCCSRASGSTQDLVGARHWASARRRPASPAP